MIERVDVELFSSPIVVPFAISREVKDEAAIVLIRLTDEAGRTGLGEASPFVTLTGDTAQTAYDEAKRLAAELGSCTFDHFRARLREVYDDSRRRSATAIVGFEMALYDLVARRLGKPLWQLFGSGPLRTLTTDITLPILPPVGIERFWQHFKDHGFQVIKIKVSGNVAADLDMIATFFRIAGQPLAFSLDGNQGFDLKRSLQLTTKLQALGLKPLFFEQPLPADDWHGLAALTKRASLPICLDESAQSCADLHHAKELGAGTMINLKIMKSGLAETERMVVLAASLGFKMMIGGMLESEVAMNTSLHLAASSNAIHCLDLDTPYFFERHPTKGSPWTGRTALLTPGSGLGSSLEFSTDLFSGVAAPTG